MEPKLNTHTSLQKFLTITELQIEIENEVSRLRSLGWKKADFAKALSDLIPVQLNENKE